MRRPRLSFLAWSPAPGRSAEIAAALGGEDRCYYSRRLASKRLLPLRYTISALRTVVYLAARRPKAVIVTNPPIFPGLIAYLYCRLASAPLVLDSHPGSFGLKGDRLGRAMLPAHRWLARRAERTLVSADDLAREVQGWGGRPLVVHEAPPEWSAEPPRPAGDVLRLLFVTVFELDEPVDQVLEAVRGMESVELAVTGDPRKCPPRVRELAGPNVTFTGFLRGEDFIRAIADADVVIALTTEPTSVVRVGYEAVYGRRPLIVSNWENLREVFPYAVHVENTSASIAEGIRTAQLRLDELRSLTASALSDQLLRWQQQLDGIERALDGNRTDVATGVTANAAE